MKLYLVNSPCIVRVDNIKSFKQVIESREVKSHFVNLIASMQMGKPLETPPCVLVMPDVAFAVLEKDIKSKISSVSKPSFGAFALSMASNRKPAIVILSETYKATIEKMESEKAKKKAEETEAEKGERTEREKRSVEFIENNPTLLGENTVAESILEKETV